MKRALILLAACSRAAATEEAIPDDEVWLSPAQMTAAGIRVDAAEARTLPHAIEVTGKVAFDDLRVSHVFSPVTGRVARVLAKAGTHVAKGAPLATIMSPDVGNAYADLVKAQAGLAATRTAFAREQALVGEDATSKRSFETAQDAYRRATAEYARAAQRTAQLQAGGANVVTQELVLRSPIAGEVIARSVAPGAEVAGQYGGGTAPELFTVGDIERVWVNADVPEGDAVKVGEPVEVRVVAYPDRVFRGAIDLVAATVDPALRTVRVRCALDNPDQALKPEMFASVAILEAPDARVVVPTDAVVAVNEATYVFVAAGQRADGRRVFKRRLVTVEPARDGVIPIAHGVAAGERVVVTGSIARDQPNDEVWPTAEQLAEGGITTAVVEERSVGDAIAVGARLAFDDTRIAHVFSPVNGRITRVLAQPGQRVAAGTPLAAITSPDVGAFLADLAKADADRTAASHEAARQRELVTADVGAKRDLEAAETAELRANAEYQRAKQLVDLLRASDYDAVSQAYVLRSPIAGEVLARHASPGLEVQGQYANGGSASNVAELFAIGDVDTLWVLGDVFELDLARVHEGDEVTISAGETLHGTVEWISDVLDPVLHTAKLRCAIANPGHQLRPDMYERVQVHVPPAKTLGVPRKALMRVDGQTYVFVRTGEHKPDGGIVFERRPVTANLDGDAAWVPVSQGLKLGETVAVDHSLMLLGLM